MKNSHALNSVIENQRLFWRAFSLPDRINLIYNNLVISMTFLMPPSHIEELRKYISHILSIQKVMNYLLKKFKFLNSEYHTGKYFISIIFKELKEIDPNIEDMIDSYAIYHSCETYGYNANILLNKIITTYFKNLSSKLCIILHMLEEIILDMNGIIERQRVFAEFYSYINELNNICATIYCTFNED